MCVCVCEYLAIHAACLALRHIHLVATMENVNPLAHMLTPSTGAGKGKMAVGHHAPPTPLTPSRLCDQFDSALRFTPHTPAQSISAYMPTPQSEIAQATHTFGDRLPATPLLAKNLIPAATAESPLTQLPQCVLLLVFKQLAPRDLCMLSAVNRKCRELVDDNDIWRPHVNELRAKYGLNVAASESLRALFCDFKNHERRYSMRRLHAKDATEQLVSDLALYSSVCWLLYFCLRVQFQEWHLRMPFGTPHEHCICWTH